jgi:hypothetical protein
VNLFASENTLMPTFSMPCTQGILSGLWNLWSLPGKMPSGHYRYGEQKNNHRAENKEIQRLLPDM